jgi:3-oxoacyl-[acyl-carrier protein] reductase
VYVATKAYLRELSKVWATENSKFNISANTVSPSYMPTSFTWKMDERVVGQMKENHPLKKLLSPEEVAETVAFLATTSNHMNGMDIVLNAGMDIK